MKTVLAPIDFSEASINAAHYAASIAKDLGANLILCHIYNLPITATDAPVIMIDPKLIEDGVKTGLENKVKEFKKEYPINISEMHSLDFPVDGICEIARNNKVDLVVMGISGAGKLKEWLIGSTATGLLKQAKFPVLIIPEGCKFKSIKKVLITRDWEEIDAASLPVLKEIIQHFKSHVQVLNVMKFHQVSPVMADIVHEKAVDHLEQFSPKVHFIERQDTVEAINEFINDNKIDMAVMIPRSHNFFEKIFIGSISKKMAFHTHVPLLSLPSHHSIK